MSLTPGEGLLSSEDVDAASPSGRRQSSCPWPGRPRVRDWFVEAAIQAAIVSSERSGRVRVTCGWAEVATTAKPLARNRPKVESRTWRYRSRWRLVRQAVATGVWMALPPRCRGRRIRRSTGIADSSRPRRSMTPALMTTTASSGGSSRRMGSGCTMDRPWRSMASPYRRPVGRADASLDMVLAMNRVRTGRSPMARAVPKRFPMDSRRASETCSDLVTHVRSTPRRVTRNRAPGPFLNRASEVRVLPGHRQTPRSQACFGARRPPSDDPRRGGQRRPRGSHAEGARTSAAPAPSSSQSRRGRFPVGHQSGSLRIAGSCLTTGERTHRRSPLHSNPPGRCGIAATFRRSPEQHTSGSGDAGLEGARRGADSRAHHRPLLGESEAAPCRPSARGAPDGAPPTLPRVSLGVV